MKTIIRVLIVVLLVSFASRPSLADESSRKAQMLIDRCISVMGGKKALAKTRHSIIKDKGVYYGFGEGVPYEGRYVLDASKSPRYRMEIIGQFVSVTANGKSWMQAMGSLMDVEGKALEVANRGLRVSYALSLIPLAEPNKEFKLSLADPATVEGDECAGVKISHKDMPTITMMFSKKTGLIKMVEFKGQVPEMDFKTVTERTVFQAYKTFEGFLAATKMTMYRDGKKFVESNPFDVTFPKKLDDKEFAKPKSE